MHTDIDECAEDMDGCAQICTDTDGSYTCSCDSGYNLANDSHGCDGKQSVLILHKIITTLLRC